ncbi:MAG TPA: hypothetical protein VMV29_00625, partial [Ktedonobacterales bacterium]|nr:hypothetical protein [Ktedonobacterales bacterium]
MNEKKKEALASRLLDIAKHAGEIDPSAKHGVVTAVVREGATIYLSGNYYVNFHRTCSDCMKEKGWMSRFSQTYIEDRLLTLIALAVQTPQIEFVREALDEFITSCESHAEVHVVYLPLDGIILRIKELEIGPILLKNMRDKSIEDFERDISMTIREHTSSEEEAEQRIKPFR